MPQMGESIFEGTITKWLKKAGDQSRKTSRSSKSPPTRSMRRFPSPIAGSPHRDPNSRRRTVQINTVVAIIGVGLATTSARITPPQRGCPHRRGRLRKHSIRTQKAPHVAPASRLFRQVQSPYPAVASALRLSSAASPKSMASISVASPAPATRPHHQRRYPLHCSSLPSSQSTSTNRCPAARCRQAVPLSRMRAIIAQRMVESKRISPHVHTVYKVDMTRIVRLRERRKDRLRTAPRRQAHLHALHRRGGR